MLGRGSREQLPGRASVFPPTAGCPPCPQEATRLRDSQRPSPNPGPAFAKLCCDRSVPGVECGAAVRETARLGEPLRQGREPGSHGPRDPFGHHVTLSVTGEPEAVAAVRLLQGHHTQLGQQGLASATLTSCHQ